MAAPLQAHTRGPMLLARTLHRLYQNKTKARACGRGGGGGFTVTELMVVLVIIGILAAVATPSFTKDNTARKGREFARMVAQTLQRAHLEAMSARVVHSVILYSDRAEVWRSDVAAQPIRTLRSPSFGGDASSLSIWDANSTATTPSGRVLGTVSPAGMTINFTPVGNASAAGSTTPSNWQIYIRNEALDPANSDSGFLVTVTGLTSFVSMRNFGFP